MVAKPSEASSCATVSSTSSDSMNSCGALGEFLLAALGFFGFGQDVDLPAGELGGEAHILAAAADGERQLLVGHHHFDAVGVFVQHHLGDFGGRQRIDDEGRRLRPTTE